jgi:hypothetical protein
MGKKCATIARVKAPSPTETTMKKKTKDPNRYPKGLNRRKVQALIAYYDNQTDEEAVAEAEAAYRKRNSALVEVPIRLLPKIRQMIARSA